MSNTPSAPLAARATAGDVTDWNTNEATLELTLERGALRVQHLGNSTVRLRFAPGGFVPRRPWSVVPEDDAFASPAARLVERPEALEWTSGDVTVVVARSGGRVSFRHANGSVFAGDLEPPSVEQVRLSDTGIRARDGDALPEGRHRTLVRARKAIRSDEHLYGFGQRTGSIERSSRTLSHWTVDPEFGHGRHQDNLYMAIPYFLAVRSGFAWGMYLNVSSFSRFRAPPADGGALHVEALGGELDLFVFAGPTPARVLEQYTRVTGRPFLPPAWSLGYHQSRWGYRSDDEMRELVREFRARGIPLDALHFDIDYMRGYRDFTWDPERFPDPAGLVRHLREHGVRAVTIIDPGVKNDRDNGYDAADSGIAGGHFLTDEHGTPFTGFCWPEEALFPDFASEAARRWWGEQHRRSHVDVGVAGIWNDMNEPSTFDAPFDFEGIAAKQLPVPLGHLHGGEERAPHAEVHNMYGHLMARATYEGFRDIRPDARPWVLTRSAFAGTQSFAVGWMGDNNSWWEHLQMSLPQLMSMGLSGMPFVGVDIGGFFDDCSPELYARWIELGTFYPFMRTHTCKGTRRQEPWSFGADVEDIARGAISLRYRLLPYLATLAHAAHEHGEPILRPLVYDFPDDDVTRHIQDQAMFGPHLMIAPALEPGVRHRSAYLPDGVWYDAWTGGRVAAGHVGVATPLGRIPLFVRGGAILPLGNVRSSTAEPLLELTLAVYPAGSSSFALLEDDGETFGYERGEVARTLVRAEEDAGSGTVTVRIHAREGGFVPAERSVFVRVHTPVAPTSVRLDGEEVRFAWLEDQRAVLVSCPDDGRAHEVVVP